MAPESETIYIWDVAGLHLICGFIWLAADVLLTP